MNNEKKQVPITAVEQVQGVPLAYVSQKEIAKLSDARLAGVGVMLNKEPRDGLVAIYITPPAAPTHSERSDEKLIERWNRRAGCVAA
jgi:hypothetical protein